MPAVKCPSCRVRGETGGAISNVDILGDGPEILVMPGNIPGSTKSLLLCRHCGTAFVKGPVGRGRPVERAVWDRVANEIQRDIDASGQPLEILGEFRAATSDANGEPAYSVEQLRRLMSTPTKFREHYIRTMQAISAAGLFAQDRDVTSPDDLIDAKADLSTPDISAPEATDLETLWNLLMDAGQGFEAQELSEISIPERSENVAAEFLCLTSAEVLAQKLVAGDRDEMSWARPTDADPGAGSPPGDSLFHHPDFIAHVLAEGTSWLDGRLDAGRRDQLPSVTDLATALSD